MSTGTIKKVAGPLVIATGMRDANMFDVVRVSSERLIGEIIEMHGDEASIQVYEETSGLGPGEPVESINVPLSVELGPGLIGSIFDGIQRPLDEIRRLTGNNLKRGVEVPSLNREKKWSFVPSVAVGDELEAILDAIENGAAYTGIEEKRLQTGVHVLPDLSMDTTDRNRTSPFAFTGNKFEFRMLGSAISISCPNIMLNTIAAEELRQFADQLEGSADLEGDVRKIVQRVMKEHKRIIFNGDGYSEAWTQEAKRRGLLNLPTTVDALPRYLDQKNVELFTSHKIYTEAEMEARYETILEEYSKTLNIEALTMSEMTRQDILPAVSAYIASLADAVASKRAVISGLPCAAETSLIQKLSGLLDSAYEKVEALDALVADGKASEYDHNTLRVATYYKDKIIPAMSELRAVVDQMEVDTSAAFWPYPSYGDLMFRV